MTVELGHGDPKAEHLRGEYIRREIFRVHRILRGSNGLKLEGWRFSRLNQFDSRFPHQMNEVCLLAKTQHGDGQNVLMESLELIDASNVYRRRKLTLTNQDFPAQSFRDHTTFDSQGPNVRQAEFDILSGSELTCRWIYITRKDNKRQVPYEATHRMLNESEADEGAKIPDVCRRMQFRDNKIPRVQDGVTFGDGFCGAGGVSQGAHDAGLIVKWGKVLPSIWI